MLDIKWIRDNPEAFDASQKSRGQDVFAKTLIDLDEERRALLTEMQELQALRNTLAKEIGQAKAKGEDAAEVAARASSVKTDLSVAEASANERQQQLQDLLARIPNVLDKQVPEGGEEDATVVSTQGQVPEFSFEPKSHDEIGEALGLMDFAKAAQISGARFVILKGALSRLERALGAFMLDVHTSEFGYQEVNPPLLVRDDALFGTGQLPKFEEDQFLTTDQRWLIPTAEVPLTNLVREEVLPEEKLPQRFTAFTYCFRSEAGSAGRDTRGMIRQHQFSKVELVSIAHPDESEKELEHLTKAAETILQRLGLAYRKILLAAQDTGANASKTYDLEVWLPSQGCYREISSCSLDTDYQARRMNARWAPKSEGKKEKPRFVHTLNGSGLAVGRTLVALLENYQNEDGSVTLPEVLRPYMNGKKEITSDGQLV